MLIIPGFTPADKVPGVVAINEFGAGRLSIGAIPLSCVLLGNMLSGTANLNERTPVSTPEQADTLLGARSELARMCHAALDIPGVTLYACPVEEASGASQAALTLLLGGTWSSSGEITLRLDEQVIRIAVAASHTPTTLGDAVEAAIENAQGGRLFCTAVNTAGSVAMTVASAGVRGNQHLAFLDTSKAPVGLTATLLQNTSITKSSSGPVITVSGTHTEDTDWVITISTGGAEGTAVFAITGNGDSVATGVTVPTTPGNYSVPGTSLVVNFPSGTYVLSETYSWSNVAALTNRGQPFFGGAGTDDLEDAIDALGPVTNDYIAPAQNDVTNVGLVETSVTEKAAFDVGRLEFYVVCRNRGLTDAIALGQTGMNDVRGTCLWPQDHVEHPSRTAARVAALLSVTEGAQPNTNWDDVIIPGAAPHASDVDIPNRTTLNAALNNSVSPLVTVNGNLQFTRLITSKSLSGATPDYRTYDRGDAAVPTRVRKELVAFGLQLKQENPFAGPDAGEGLPPAGTMTPRLWNSKVQAELQKWEGPEFNWLTEVEENLPESEWDSDGKRIMSVVPTVVKAQNHQLGIIVRQTAA